MLQPTICKPSALFCLFWMFSCNSPEARLERLQHRFWDNFARHDYFEVKLKNEVLHWPLPPSPDVAGNRTALLLALQNEAKAIESEKLTEKGKHQLLQLNAALAQCALQGSKALFDPSRCCIVAGLQRFSDHSELSTILDSIPAYYQQIEQQWQSPNVKLVEKAVGESQVALDVLQSLEERGEVETGPARAAVKDFIGLCQSAWLEAH